jgi:hypothetical protein
LEARFAAGSNPTGAIATLALLFLGSLAGVLTAFGGPTVGLVLAGLLLAPLVVLLPIRWLFWVLILTTFVVAGPVQYFGKVGKIFWVPYLLGFIFLVRVILERLFSSKTNRPQSLGHRAGVGLTGFVVLYIVALGVSTLFNASPALQVLLSAKEYFFLLGAGLAVYWGQIPLYHVDLLLKKSHWFLLAQLPVVAYQRFVVAANRTGSSSWDAVVGLMSGDPEGGGASATMALIVLVIMTYHLAMRRAGVCSMAKLLLVLATGLASIALAEVKYAIILLPVALGLVYSKEIIRHPVFGTFFTTFILALSAVVLVAYQSQFSGQHTKASKSLTDYVEVTIERNSAHDSINMATGEMGRIAAFTFWWRAHGLDNPVHLFLGHGIGASRVGTVMGEEAKRYQFRLARSATVALLWEGGLIAAVAVLGLMVVIVFRGISRLGREKTPDQKAVIQTATIGTLLVLAMMPYGPDILFVSQAQLLFVLLAARVLAPRRDHSGPTISADRRLLPHWSRARIEDSGNTH